MENDQKRNAIKSSLKRQLCFPRQLKTYSLHNLYELNILAFRITMACLKRMHCLAFGIFTSSVVLICLVWVCCCCCCCFFVFKSKFRPNCICMALSLCYYKKSRISITNAFESNGIEIGTISGNSDTLTHTLMQIFHRKLLWLQLFAWNNSKTIWLHSNWSNDLLLSMIGIPVWPSFL